MIDPIKIINADVFDGLRQIEDGSVNCVVTSPPYWGLRDYGVAGQLGLESTPEEYVDKMVDVFREVRRVLRADGTLWLNLGDTYASDDKWGGSSGGKNGYCTNGNEGTRQRRTTGLKSKDLIGIPWRVAFALQADGWYLRSDIIWSKPNPLPESVRDRPTKAHEYLFLLAKSERYYFDADAVKEPAIRAGDIPGGNNGRGVGIFGVAPHAPFNGIVPEHRNIRSVWNIATQPYSEAHFATFPEALVKPCVLAGCPVGGVVLDPFGGSGTVGKVSIELGRRAVLIELSAEYSRLIEKRLKNVTYGMQFEARPASEKN